MTAELVEFTRQALAKGIRRDEILGVLRKAGWDDADAKTALDAFAETDFPLPVPKPKPYLPAREVFLYLVMFVALYVTAYHLGALTFNFIDRAFPDPLQHPRVLNFVDEIRLDIATLIVAFPLFLYTFRIVNGSIARDPTKRASRPRKWLTYLTLFIAVVSLTADMTTLVYNVLGGELTLRFFLKVLTVAVIAGGTFAYFLWDIRKGEEET
jgi:hypothetical protein